MKIKQIRLQRFRQFADTAFDVGPLNLLVGPNNSGKTSLLHAIRAFFLLMHGHISFEGNPPVARYHRRFSSNAEEIAPTPDIWELWYRQQTGTPITISITFENDITISVVIKQQFGQIHISTEDLPNTLTQQDVSDCLGTSIAFIPGLVGVLVSEPYATHARRNALATQGRYSEIFRSSLQQLNQRNPELINTINEWLKGLFNITVTSISFDGEADEFVTVKYTQNGVEYDVVSSGSGLQQIIQMLTYLYLGKPKILLIDEPDAHLHSKLQAKLGELLRRVANDLDAQVFLSTHSLDLIDTFSTNEVLVIDSSKRNIASIGHNADLISAMVDANIVDVSALSRLLASRRLVVIEDEDKTIFKSLDKALGAPLFSSKSNSYVLPAKGVGNFRSIALLGNVLKELTGTTFELTLIQDRDGMPDFMVTPFLESQRADNIDIHLLERHEIESYLLGSDLIQKGLAFIGRNELPDRISAAILSSANNLKAEARRASFLAATNVNRHFTGAARINDADLELQVYRWFDNLDLTSIEVVQRVFPGKEMLKEVLRILNEGPGKSLTRGHLVACMSREFVQAEIVELLERLSEVPVGDESEPQQQLI